jgi:hypothetical protein
MKWVGLLNRENRELCDVSSVCFLSLLIKNPGNVTSIHGFDLENLALHLKKKKKGRNKGMMYFD